MYAVNQGCMYLCQPVIWSMAAMLRDSVVVVVVVVRTRPRAIPLAMITMRKSTRGFPFVFQIWVAYGAPLICGFSVFRIFPTGNEGKCGSLYILCKLTNQCSCPKFLSASCRCELKVKRAYSVG